MKGPTRDLRRREIGGPDPLDRRLGEPPPSPFARVLAALRVRSALGLAPSLTPAIIFLPLGALLGPLVLGVLSPIVLDRLEIVVTIALSVLGVLVGVALGREVRGSWPLLVAASLESGVTIAVVAAGAAYFAAQTQLPLGAPAAVMALALGLCASASSATSAHPDSEPAAELGTRVADLDDVLPIVAVAVVLLLLRPTSAFDVSVTLVAPLVAGAIVGLIGWLIFERAESAAERVVFVLGALAVAGGTAAHLGVSPLMVGLTAGMFWTLAPGRTDRIVQDDLRKVQHPLVVLLLITAGARWVPSLVAIWWLAPYLICRLAGKVAGGWLSARVLGRGIAPGTVSAADLAAFLMPPGVLAVAFALNFQQMLPDDAGTILLSTVAAGTAIFELFSVLVLPRWRGRPA
jgi:hypothetical protein